MILMIAAVAADAGYGASAPGDVFAVVGLAVVGIALLFAAVRLSRKCRDLRSRYAASHR